MLSIALIVALAVLAVAGLLATAGAALAWRRQRQSSRRLAEQLVVEARLEWLTRQTLQAMQQAARQSYRGSLS